MSKPAALALLDEPSLGLSPVLVQLKSSACCARVRELGVAILLAEQNAKLSLAIADRGYVIETGKIVREGTGAPIARELRHHGTLPRRRCLEHQRRPQPRRTELTRRLAAIL